jgi:hypothetical protein
LSPAKPSDSKNVPHSQVLSLLTPPQSTQHQQPHLLCSQCSAGFSDFESFRTHLRSHIEKDHHHSQQSHSTLTTPPPSTTTATPPPASSSFYPCPQCVSSSSSSSVSFQSVEQLESHLALHHYLSTSTEYGCQSCCKLFGKPDELQKHLLDIHAHHLYRCALCKEVFDSKVSIQVHFAVKHSNECKVLACNACSTTGFTSEHEFMVSPQSSTVF